MRRRWREAYTESFPLPDVESLACVQNTPISHLFNEPAMYSTNRPTIRRISHLFEAYTFRAFRVKGLFGDLGLHEGGLHRFVPLREVIQ